MSQPLQNDPDRAGGLVSDAQGEFVADEPGGAFDPRSFREPVDRDDAFKPRPFREPVDRDDAFEPRPFREPVDRDDDVDAAPDAAVATPPMDDERMSGPGEEIDKAG
jgi:hypothetical protein